MIKSMTGFGRSKNIADGFEINIDIRSVNHRYLDLYLRIPKYYSFLEDKIRATVGKYISRGKIELNIFIKKTDSDEKLITLNEPLCDNYIDVLTALKNKLGTDDIIDVRMLTRFSDIFEISMSEADEEEITKTIISVLEKSLKDFVEMREREGERITKDIMERLSEIETLGKEVEKRAPQIVEDYRLRLTAKLNELLTNIDNQRIVQEAAIYADKITTAEETVRLSSHITEFRGLLKKGGTVGKKLDFLVQEMNREVNTIGSKCNDFETSKLVVELKSQIENIREQIQNIE